MRNGGIVLNVCDISESGLSVSSVCQLGLSVCCFGVGSRINLRFQLHSDSDSG